MQTPGEASLATANQDPAQLPPITRSEVMTRMLELMMMPELVEALFLRDDPITEVTTSYFHTVGAPPGYGAAPHYDPERGDVSVTVVKLTSGNQVAMAYNWTLMSSGEPRPTACFYRLDGETGTVSEYIHADEQWEPLDYQDIGEPGFMAFVCGSLGEPASTISFPE